MPKYAVTYRPAHDPLGQSIKHVTADRYDRDGDLIEFSVGKRPVFSIKSAQVLAIEERG